MIDYEKNKEWILDMKELRINQKCVLGEGQYGKVIQGTWRGILVAIKIFHNLDDHKIRLIRNEFEAMTKLHHPNIIQLLGYTENPFMIVMEYCENGSLNQYLHSHSWISQYKKCKMMMDITKGLAYLHGRKPSYIIHRDLKPGNLLVTKYGQIKIADFGICKILRKSFTDLSSESFEQEFIMATSKCGTPYYMAPELLLCEDVITMYDYSVDIYSLGSVMYEIFEHQKLFGECQDRNEFLSVVQDKTFPIFYKTNPCIQKIISQCLSHDPKQRPNALILLKKLGILKKRFKWWLRCSF